MSMPMPEAWPRYRPDWRAVGWLTAALLVVASLPTALGLALQTPQLAYTGARWFSPQDAPVYYGWIRQAAEGEWLLSNRFSAEPGVRGTLNLYWVVVGKLAALMGLSPMAAFALAQLVSIPLMVLAVDFLASRVLASRGDRRWALALACLASGWGFMLLPWLDATPDLFTGVPATPVDLWVPEATLVHTALHSGHLAAAVAVLAVTAGAWINALRLGRLRSALAAGLWSALLFSFHPFEAVLVGSLVLLTTAVAAVRGLRLAWVLAGAWALAASPPLLVHLWSLGDPRVAARAAQNVILSPSAATLPWALGLLGVAAVVGAARALRQGTWRDAGTLVLLTWVPLQLGLLYAPVAFQRRLMIGLPVGLALLGAPVLRAAAISLRRHLPWAWAGHLAVAILGVALLAPSSAYVLAHDLDLIVRRHPAVFADRAELDALAWIAEHTPSSAVVLAPPAWGGRVPAWAGRTTVAGHPIETVDAAAKARLAQRYFAGTLDAAVAEAWLRQQRVTHVLVPRGTGFAAGAGLNEFFANSAVVIYAVVPP